MPLAARDKTQVKWWTDNTAYQSTRKKTNDGWSKISDKENTFEFYADMHQEGWNMRDKAREYIDWCKNNAYRPKFDWGINSDYYRAYCEENGYTPNQQIIDMMDADTTNGVWNQYYKFLTDFTAYKPVFNEEGEMIDEIPSPQQRVISNFDMTDLEKEVIFEGENSMLARREGNIALANQHVSELADRVVSYLLGNVTEEEMNLRDDVFYDARQDANAYLEATGNLLYSTIGERGAQNDKTAEGVARLNNLEVARQMESELNPDWSAKSDENALKIKVATGWERGADGKWRYEIPDGQIVENPKLERTEWITDWGEKRYEYVGKLSDVYDSPELYRVYPFLKDVTIEINPYSIDGETGFYSAAANLIKVVSNYTKWVVEHSERFKYLEKKLDDALENVPDDEVFKFLEEYEKTEEGRELNELGEKEKGHFEAGFPDYEREGSARGTLIHEIQHAIQKHEGFAKGTGVLNQNYRRYSGEVESRNVEERMDMTPEERRNTLLAATEDVERKDQIFIMDDMGISALIADKSEVNAYDQAFGTELKEWLDYIDTKVIAKGKTQFYIANAGLLLNSYGIKGKINVSRKAVNPKRHTKNIDHELTSQDWINVVNSINDPLYITQYNNNSSSFRIYTTAIINGKNICVGVDVNTRNGVEITKITTAFGRDISKVYSSTTEKVLYDKAKATNGISGSDNSHLYQRQLSEDKDTNKSYTNKSIQEEKLFSTSNTNQAIFVSNAAKAVEGIKMEKATPEQWLKMIEKNGGLKAGEDKWMGLSDWLKASDKKTLTKDEVLAFINEHMIQIEEVHYGQIDYRALEEEIHRSAVNGLSLEELQQMVDEEKKNVGEFADSALLDYMIDEFGDDFDLLYDIYDGRVRYRDLDYVELEEYAQNLGEENGVRPIDDDRLLHTTKGLTNNHEIALTVPTIESWKEDDELHFGDAGEGRAVAWIRFGETWEQRPSPQISRKVLVIDEIQSNRHQKGREKGYVSSYDTSEKLEDLNAALDKKVERRGELIRDKVANEENEQTMLARIGIALEEVANIRDYDAYTKERDELVAHIENRDAEIQTLTSEIAEIEEEIKREERYLEYKKSQAVEDAPFEKNWHEVAMKRMLRYAAENGYGAVAWTKGEQQNKRYGLSKHVTNIESEFADKKSTEGSIRIYFTNGDNHHVGVDKATGLVTFYNENTSAIGKPLSDLLGKELADKILNHPLKFGSFSGLDLELSEGMKGFYDKMLPAFMNKYGKKWGIKVEDINLPNLEEAGRVMHSVPVTEEMKQSVMEGQLMFSTKGADESAKDFIQNATDAFYSRYNTVAPAAVVYANSRKMVAEGLGIDVDNLTDEVYKFIREKAKRSGGLFLPMQFTKEDGTVEERYRILIFAKDAVNMTAKADRILFHENTHGLISEMPELLDLGQWLLGSDERITSGIAADVKAQYDEDDWAEEMACDYVGVMLSLGRGQEALNNVADEYKPLLNSVYERFGYNPEDEDPRRRSERNKDARELQMRNTESEANSNQREEKLFSTVITPEVRREMDVISAQAIVNGNYLKAPNDKDTKLTPEQWSLVRTQNFKKWFGDWINDPENASKVVDENGEPMVVYHGTAGVINTFEDQQRSPGFWFVDREDVANGYAESAAGEFGEEKNIIPVFLNMRNPRIEDAFGQYPSEFTLKAYVENDNGIYEVFDTLAEAEAYREANVPDGWVGSAEVGDQHDLVERAKELGYDGVIMLNMHDQAAYAETRVEGTQTNYVVLNDNQIKSATENTGEFSESEDIRFSTSTDKSVDEIVLEGKQKVAAENREAADAFMNRIRRINGNLQKLRMAAAAQREYDQKTIKTITDVANDLLEGGALNDMTKGEIKRLLSIINGGVGKSDLTISINRLMDLMVANQLRYGKSLIEKFLKIRGSKVDQRGVEVRGTLDIPGQQMLNAFKEGIGLSKEKLADRIADAEDALASDSETKKRNAENELVGLYLAKQYHEDINDSIEEEKDLRNEIKVAQADYKAGNITRDMYVQLLDSINEAILDNRIQRVNAYEQLASDLGAKMVSSIKNAGLLRDAEKERVQKIQHFANSDMKGMPASTHEVKESKFWNSPLISTLTSPLITFEQWLRVFGEKSAEGKGYLWNYFMTKWNNANNNEYKGMQEAHRVLDSKVRSIFGDNYTRWSDLFSIEKKMPTLTVSIWDDGEMKDYELSQGNLLYIYMVNKMTDGKMKLRKMGITQDVVDAIVLQMDPRFIQLADWMQETFLPSLRDKYNAVHERLFGAPMASIDNYFPIKVNQNARVREVDVEAGEGTAKPATITGSIIKRTKNSLALDIRNADAFDVLLEHVQQMEHWAAFAEFNKDLNTLLSYKKFRNRVQNMSGVFGSGTEAWKNFKESAEIAAGVYKPKTSGTDKAITNIVKGLTAGKISFRLWTAMKQILSMPAFAPYADLSTFAKNLATPISAFEWAMENLPAFEKRWRSREAGNVRLKKTEVDIKVAEWMETMTRLGMTPNAFVDAITCAIGAKSVYETKYNQYVKDGYTHEQADEKAKLDATVTFNATQQSSEAAVLSAIQIDRTFISHALTVFRNNSFGMQRELADAVRNMRHRMSEGYKEQSIEFMKKQMVRDGLAEDKAERAAQRIYRNSVFKDAARIATFGFMMQFLWALGNSAVYLLFGDDDEDKREMIKDAAIRGAFGSIEGLGAGNFIADGLSALASGEFDKFNPSFAPAISDIENLADELKRDMVAGASDLINILVQAGVGVNPQVLADAALAIYDACNGDLETSKEVGILILRMLQAPQSNIDKLFADEIDFTKDKGLDLTIEEFAKRYADYKYKRNAPYTFPLYTDEGEEKQEAKYIKRFLKDAEELKRSRGNEEAKKYYEYLDTDYKETTETINELRRKAKESAMKGEQVEAMEYAKMLDDFMKTDLFQEYVKFGGKTKAIEAIRDKAKKVDLQTRESLEDMMLELRRELVEEMEKANN